MVNVLLGGGRPYYVIIENNILKAMPASQRAKYEHMRNPVSRHDIDEARGEPNLKK